MDVVGVVQDVHSILAVLSCVFLIMLAVINYGILIVGVYHGKT